jgi:glutaredoxin
MVLGGALRLEGLRHIGVRGCDPSEVAGTGEGRRTMKFYDCQSAPSPRRVRIFLAEKGIELPTVQVDLGAGEHLGEPFRSLNPDCTVPVLELDDGTALTESFAWNPCIRTRR